MECLDKFPPITDNPGTGIRRFYTQNSETISWYSSGVKYYCLFCSSVRAN